MFQHTRTQRPVLEIGEDMALEDIPELEGDHHSTPTATSLVADETHEVQEAISEEDDAESTTSTAQV